jgi:hypothetical protein
VAELIHIEAYYFPRVIREVTEIPKNPDNFNRDNGYTYCPIHGNRSALTFRTE